MKVGIIGIRHVHADGLAACVQACGAELSGAYERDASVHEGWTRTPILDRAELIGRSDAIIVAGTNRERVEDTLTAAAAGLPVLCEKPVAADASELDRLIDEVDSGRIMVALPVRFAETLQQAREAIAGGAIGTALAARGTNHGQFPGGWFGSMADSGGGAMQDHIVHLSDVLCWLLDDRVVRSYARASQVMHPDNDVEDCGIVTLDFESGFFASIDASWSRPATFPTWGDVWLEIVGTAGRMRIDPMATHLDFYNDQAGLLQHVGYAADDMTRSMVQAFLDFAGDQTKVSPVTLDEGIHASDIVLASYASVASGRPEPVMAR